MVLTEPDAGSDVGAARTRRSNRKTAPGTSKASSGSSPTATPTTSLKTSPIWCWRDLSARTGNQRPEPVLRAEVSARPGDRRTRRAQRRVRHRPRTQDGAEGVGHLRADFRQHGVPAVGWLVGDTHRGIAQMFKLMEFARMAVGIKAISTLSTGI